ncbi:ATP-binding protein [Desulfopila sp. IMCC35008]|uniref:ATP-binding protein n=1 Tax=Desulfopila sp. IMCC35008 TaxID=2653858 RepID=UPI0013D3B67B|nr:ATP-binding protein [Desulfopila sp. IMCC35008]
MQGGTLGFHDHRFGLLINSPLQEILNQKIARPFSMHEKILFVDDEVHILDSMKRQLRKRFDVVTAESGKQGQEVYREMWSTIGSGKVYRGPLINRRKDGQEYIAEVTISPIWNQYKEITHYVSVQRDITQEKAMERELRHAQKLEALGTLAGGIAHEINTPAQFVTSNLSFVHESFGDIRSYISESLELLTSTDDTKGVSVSRVRSICEEHDIEYLVEEFPLALKQSIDGIKQITNIVLSMKQFAHPGEDKQVAADINEAIRNSVTVCRNEWKYIADINFELDEELPHIECHISDINQVILNIIVNAAHALESAGYGTTEKGWITIRSRQKKGGILIAIEDNGGGIPESIKARIFDPFFTTKEVGKGTGQGLAIAYSIITEKHGGKLSFTSTDQGTVFYIQLPVT